MRFSNIHTRLPRVLPQDLILFEDSFIFFNNLKVEPYCLKSTTPQGVGLLTGVSPERDPICREFYIMNDNVGMKLAGRVP